MTDQIERLYVDKVAGTLADGLLLQGVALLTDRLLEAQVNAQQGDISDSAIHIKDCGNYYQLTMTPPISLPFVQEFAERLELAPLLVTLKNRATLETPDALRENVRRVDYEAVKQERAEYFEWRKTIPNIDAIPSDARRAVPDLDWAIYRALNPAALPGYNTMLQAWGKAMARIPGETLGLLLDLFSTTPNDLERAVQRWKKLDKAHNLGIKAEVTNLQLYNPDQGKGQNRVKADRLEMNNVAGFWMLEVLKAAGLYQGGITNTVQGGKDRKSYVLAPTSLNLADNRNIMEKFKPAMQIAQPPIKFDIKATIEYCKAMFAYAKENTPTNTSLSDLFGPSLRNVVNGFYTAYYKDLGNAIATMNVSTLRLPGWIRIANSEDITTAKQVLEEFERVTFSIDEGKSDGISLLQALRDFISGSELTQLFAFTTPYAGYLMQRRERNQFVQQLSVDTIRSVIMGTTPKLEEILNNEGFKNIAYAIRQSTVTAQYKKAKLNDRKYDVRYGLNQELARRSRYPSEFIAALSEFLHKYSAENANVMETRSQPYRRNVRTADIEEIVRLVDQHGSELIANLLIAYGYASVSKTAQDSASTTTDMPADLNADADDYSTSDEE